MITGTVTSDREPVIRLVVQDARGQTRECDAIVDTGFTGWLTLPPDFIAELGLPWRESGAAILADGRRILFNVYDVTVVWDGEPITVPVDEADAEPLAGMALMHGYRLTIEDIDGGAVLIERLSG